MTYSSAIGYFVIGESPIESGGPGIDIDNPMMKQVIPSYLYWQYTDDDNLQDFVNAYNNTAQLFVDWFNQINLPIYTRAPVEGELLDWVGAGLYGYPRPKMGRGGVDSWGAYNTYRYNTTPYNTHVVENDLVVDEVTDDIYRRILTWHLFRGDGRVFNIRWLKRRIMRFLTGSDGIDPGIGQTYQIGVAFSSCCEVIITLRRFTTSVVGGAIYNTFAFNTRPYNDLEIAFTLIGPQSDLAQLFSDAVANGILELPFQYTYTVVIQ